MMRRAPFFNNPVLKSSLPQWRARLVFILLFLGFAVLAGRALFLQGLSTEFLQQQGERRYERTLTLPAVRGKITDRHGEVLASSVPARAVWAIPEDAAGASPESLAQLARLLEMNVAEIQSRLGDTSRNFVYLKRQVPMDIAEQVQALKVPGVSLQPEMRRYYPERDVAAHLVGFTNLDGRGQEGVELAFESMLSGKDGSRRVIRDRLGRVIEDVRDIHPPVDGQDIRLSIDMRLQFAVYKALQDAMEENKAKGAAAVVLDVRTGEVLALVNLPSYDPNDRTGLRGDMLRNRAVTDTFEPGSIMKPFTVALALDLKRIGVNSTFDTGNGRMVYQGRTISDVSRNGVITPGDILRRSSNIGMTLISEKLSAQEMWSKFTELGFGQAPKIGFPGVAAGSLRPWERWRLIEKATMSYGYGLSVSLMQVARAYAVFARDGDAVPLSLLQRDEAVTGTHIYSPEVARTVRGMLEAAAGEDGARRARVDGYRVAGKSGTARKIVDGKYSTKHYRSSFVGFAPASDPRLVVAVSIDEPGAGAYYGGRVAAPVFSTIMGHCLRLLGVRPDAPLDGAVAAAGGAL
ncbi:penicillin-binding protein 2 [Kerstersia similis]